MSKDLEVTEWSEEDIQRDGGMFYIYDKECNTEHGKLKFNLKI